MAKGWILPITACMGLIFASVVSVQTERAPVPAEPIRWPPSPPFDSFIAGAGVVEAREGNIVIGAPIPGIITTVAVDTGVPIQTGDLLFEVDNRPYRANQQTAQSNLEQAIANLDKVIAAPRPQERQIAEADLQQAKAQADQARDRLSRIEKLKEVSAISASDQDAARFGAAAYEAQEKGAALRLEMAREGSWEKDLQIARAAVRVAEAQLARATVDLAMTRVTSPLDGIVLLRGLDPGNYVGGPTSMVVGSTKVLRVRVDIDEVDAWRFSTSAPAFAYLRGNASVQIPLKFDKYESLVQPKRSLTLANDERVDTRVLQALYTFEPQKLPVALYVGQLLDVFIQSVPVGQTMRPASLPAGLHQLQPPESQPAPIRSEAVQEKEADDRKKAQGQMTRPSSASPAAPSRFQPPRREPGPQPASQPPSRTAPLRALQTPGVGEPSLQKQFALSLSPLVDQTFQLLALCADSALETAAPGLPQRSLESSSHRSPVLAIAHRLMDTQTQSPTAGHLAYDPLLRGSLEALLLSLQGGSRASSLAEGQLP